MWEDYKVLGLDETATDEEIEKRYQELKEKYKEDRWLYGEAGNEAAKMLTRVEVAYKKPRRTAQTYMKSLHRP